MRLSKAKLDSLPTKRLRYNDKDGFYTVPYINASEAIDLPLKLSHFKPNGRGIPWACGVSNAALESRHLFPGPVFYAHTIGTATYIVVAVYPGGQPKLAVRYNHGAQELIDAYDKSRKDPKKWLPIFKALLAKTPMLRLLKGRTEVGGKGHSPNDGHAGGHRPVKGLTGNARRMANAGFIPQAFADVIDKTEKKAA